MWIFLSDAFLSIVEPTDGPEGKLLVRARFPKDIRRVFGKDVRVTRTPDKDYLYRALVSRERVATVIADHVRQISYPNFKDFVSEKARANVYGEVWSVMYRAQSATQGEKKLPLWTLVA